MKNFLTALQFLTILPTGTRFEPERMLAHFPLVGILLGLLVATFDLLATRFWAAPVVGVLDGIFLLLLTGALHLDGLSDTVDGLYGGQRSVERSLEIMKDSRIGAMGAAAMICSLAVKFTAMGAISNHRFLMLLVIPAFARSSILFAVRYLPYGRPQGGTGSVCFQKPPRLKDGWGLLLAALLALLAGLQGVVLILVFIATVAVGVFGYWRRLGCITGDMMGALIEICETTMLLAAAVALS